VLGYDKDEKTDAAALTAAYYVLQQTPLVGSDAVQRTREIFQNLGEYHGPGEEKNE
jgi:hypothetical protein